MNLVISPHLDDAVLSCGQMIADNTDTVVLTVFAGIPTFDLLTPYDEQSSFTSSRNAVIARRAEDVRAMRVLKANYSHLDFQDSQYQPLKPNAIANELAIMIRALFGDERPRVVGPLGLRHPDHVAVHDALIDIRRNLDMDLFVYEELPYRVLWPQEAARRVQDVRGGKHADIDPVWLEDQQAKLGVGSKDLKREAVRCYASQAWSTDLDCVFVPERFWRI